jgi:DNA-binding MarR family transcriptional regulator
MKKKPSPADFVLQQSKLHAKLVKKIEGQLGFHGISFTEYLILHFLASTPKNTMRRIELAENVAISASGITRLLAPMEKIGLVEKGANPRDARVSLVKLSKAGKRLYNEASQSFEFTAELLTEGVNASQLKILIELTDKLLRIEVPSYRGTPGGALSSGV